MGVHSIPQAVFLFSLTHHAHMVFCPALWKLEDMKTCWLTLKVFLKKYHIMNSISSVVIKKKTTTSSFFKIITSEVLPHLQTGCSCTLQDDEEYYSHYNTAATTMNKSDQTTSCYLSWSYPYKALLSTDSFAPRTLFHKTIYVLCSQHSVYPGPYNPTCPSVPGTFIYP